MSDKNTGGPAFPIPGDQPDEDFNGATLRDYFAAKALQGFCTDCDPTGNCSTVATAAYRLADAMLKAREA